ncbi:unnamed protein product [Peronospora farinosa]|uniref:Telomere replication protein EST3 n=1 Tax=Peronospora farinosa TaxID=134698 RepID=A0ABN8CEL6_9STRA|nr:unnamed protein product [Peronospora farinosa]
MASGRANFTTEFLLQELLAALGAPLVPSNTYNLHADSFSESLSEETESQSALEATKRGNKSRVMLVRRTNSSQQTVTLVDRKFEVESFIPNNVIVGLQKERRFYTLGRLRGSVVRVTKYHFATLTRCLATCKGNKETSVSVPNVNKNEARVYLWVDALAIVEDNDLAIKALPSVYTHPLVVERLQMLSDAELEKQLMINQGLLPLEVGRFDDDRPLLDEDCVIPKEQEQELEEKDEWGLPTPIERQMTDSELIEENGSVPMPESQAMRDSTSPDKFLSTQESMILSGNLSTMSTTLSANLSSTLSEEMSVTPSLGNQGYLFQQENIRETFVIGSDSESSDTDHEHISAQKAKKSVPSALSSHKQVDSSRTHSPAHSSVAPAILKTTQSSWATVDLTDDSPEKAPMAIPASKKHAIDDQEAKTEDADLQNEADGNTVPPSSAYTPPRTHSPTEKQNSSTGWATSFLRLVGIGTSAAKASLPHTQSSDEEAGDLAENEKNATQILDRTEEEKKAEPAKPEDLILSQATVVLQYDADNDDDDHAFEYEGMMSDDIVSPRSAEHGGVPTQEADSTGDLVLAKEGAEVVPTPKKRPVSKKETTSTGFRTPSPSAQTATPRTEKRTEPADRQSAASMSNLKEDLEVVAPDSSQPALPLSPISSSRTGFSAAEFQGVKRRRQQINAESHSPSIIAQAELAVSQPRVQMNGKRSRSETQKHRREILSTQAHRTAGSLSPQFEQPVFIPRRPLQPVYGNGGTDSYSLNALSRSLGSRIHDLASEENQTRTSRQPRRAWKRYEKLFPPLNMTHLKQRMAENKAKGQ